MKTLLDAPIHPIEAHLLLGEKVKIDPNATGIGGSWQGKEPVTGMPRPWDPDTLQFFYEQTGKYENPVILDIGANTGTYCLLPVLNRSIRGYAFEPNPDVYRILKNNLTLNALQNNIQTIPVALSDRKGLAKLKIPVSGNDSGLACLGTPQRFHGWNEVSVPMDTLDNIVKWKNISHVDLIKIDTEGCELMVLLGGEKIIRKLLPNILVEFEERNTAQFGYHPNQIVSLLTSWGYDFIKISKSDAFFFKKEDMFHLYSVNNQIASSSINSSASFIFDTKHAESINSARLDHLESLNLPITSKSVLEVGSEIGKLTHFFENNKCQILSTEARFENIKEFKTRFPHRKIEYADLNIPGSHENFGVFQIVFCYGTLYHLHNPSLALKDLAKCCSEIFILETLVNPTDNGIINFLEEDQTANDQAMRGVGCRPSRDWIFNSLKKLYPYVYLPITQPNHDQFPTSWPHKCKSNCRSIFIASKVKIDSKSLIDLIPQKQDVLDITKTTKLQICQKYTDEIHTHKFNIHTFKHNIDVLKHIENRLYYRDQSTSSLESLTTLAMNHAPTVIVELGTLSGMSTRAWVLAAPTARVHAVDLSFKFFWKANEHFPADTSRITFHEQNILATNFKTLWTESDRVLFFVDAHDLANVPIMRHVLKNALPYLPKDSLVVVDDIWFSQERLGPDNVQEYFDKFLLGQIDELQCFTGHYAPYHKGGSFMGFQEVLPLMEFVNSRGIDLGYEPGGKHVWFPWDGERNKNQNPVRYERGEQESGIIEYNPLALRANEPLASRILPKVARLYQQGLLQESARLLVDLINKEPSQSASFALAVCQARIGQLDDANKLAQLARQAGKESWRINRLADDLEQRVGRPKVQMTDRKGLTIFAVPKAFKGHEAVIQKNAIRSWARLDPKPEIILMGNDHGVREMAQEVGARHLPDIQKNEFGTPLLNDIFYQAELASTYSILAYLNADIILTSDFIPAITHVTKQVSEFLVVGQRLNKNIKQEINFDSDIWEKDLKNKGLLHPVTGVDYFIFPKGLWSAIPPFALGRTAWDLWILGRALDLNIPLVDATAVITAIHQNHDYDHLKGGKEEAWAGVEAKRNVAIVGGYKAIQRNISSANYRLTATGLIKAKPDTFQEEDTGVNEEYVKNNTNNDDMVIKLDMACKEKSDASMVTAGNSVTWESINTKSRIMLYAGDIPDLPEYPEMIGLSLNRSDEQHLCHDITNPFALPDNFVDFFQSEDVFEHIAYNKLHSVISEIYRILKPGGLFRLSMPDYRCNILQQRVVMDANNNIIFDPEGGGTPENPGHVWFPLIEQVKELIENSPFGKNGEIEYLHYYTEDGTPVTKPIDYSKGFVRRTPDFDKRVQNPYRPMSMVIDIVKNS